MRWNLSDSAAVQGEKHIFRKLFGVKGFKKIIFVMVLLTIRDCLLVYFLTSIGKKNKFKEK